MQRHSKQTKPDHPDNGRNSNKAMDKRKKHLKSKSSQKRQNDKKTEDVTALSATAEPFQPGGASIISEEESPQAQAKSKHPTRNKGRNKKSDNDKKKQSKKEKGKNLTKEQSSASNIKPPNIPQTTNDLNYAAGSKITVLHVAEKPSIAQSISKGLCPSGKINSVGRSLPVHEFNNPSFPKAPNASKVVHRVTSVAGHVFSVDFPSQYQSWESTDPLELFTAPIAKKPCKGSIVKHLQSEAKGVDFIVLWMDCDREGENINFEVLDVTMHLMHGGSNAGSHYDRVYRAHFSAINPSDIMKAYHALGKPDKNQSLSVDARQELDLKVGVAFSRFQTRYFQGRYGDLDSAVLSYGPCQTPTLGFCVQRHVEMETFKPEPYWILDLTLLKSGRSCKALWDGGRTFNKNKIENYLQICSEAELGCIAKVNSVVSKEKKQGRPTPLNTIGLLKACSKALGIGPHTAMQVAERLYLQGYLSYPRTESTKYPASFDIKETLQSQSGDRYWGNYVCDLLHNGVNKPKGGVDMGDHPPITPMRAAGGTLSGDMARVYDLVTRHFIATVSHDAIWQSTKVCIEVDCLGEKGKFSIAGKELVTPGFLAIMMHKQYGDEHEPVEGLREGVEDEEERALPEFSVGEAIPISIGGSSNTRVSSNVKMAPSSSGSRASLSIKELMTTKPSYLTESELISRMEKHGIGTDASISTHIENILKRNYAELMPGRRIAPTKLGLVLCQGYHLIDSSLVLPKIRSDIEAECSRIAKGLANKDDVLRKAIETFQSKFEFFIKNIDKMDVLFGSSFARLADVGKPFTRCGQTRRYLQFIQGPPSRLYNKYTESVYPLPVGGTVKQWNEKRCPVDGCGFELCLYTVGSPARTFPLCPNCFNNPRKEWGELPDGGGSLAENAIDQDDEKKELQQKRLGGKTMTLDCPLQDGHPLISSMAVSPDPDSGGLLILDPTGGQKLKLLSTRSPTTVYLPQCIQKITILDDVNEVLKCHLMRIIFKPGESPLEDGSVKYVCCFPEDEMMQKLIRVFYGSDRLKAQGGRGRGRGGRGRGGGGWGRGGKGRGSRR
uniref:DNA topoisomerase n=2 Tax=Leptocylindrus danicus TaxID=163516 RepID=A0A7S2LTZ7_9STRA|mmetsp:Transcript_9995/g.14964  ORF Transcript_9995/g.14964 Transcript_9995/m.14964 type:complete len:1063 (+) Transcript_9995:304-3492(+)